MGDCTMSFPRFALCFMKSMSCLGLDICICNSKVMPEPSSSYLPHSSSSIFSCAPLLPTINPQNPTILHLSIQTPFPKRSTFQLTLPSTLIHLHARPGYHGGIIGAELDGREGKLNVREAAGGEEGTEATEWNGCVSANVGSTWIGSGRTQIADSRCLRPHH